MRCDRPARRRSRCGRQLPVRPRAGGSHVIRVLLVDDQELVRAGFRLILDAQPDIEVVGEAADGAEAVEAGRGCSPTSC